jgi:hypothetical protein
MGRGEIPMRAVAAARPDYRFLYKGSATPLFLSYDKPTYNGAAYSRLMNGVLLWIRNYSHCYISNGATALAVAMSFGLWKTVISAQTI